MRAAVLAVVGAVLAGCASTPQPQLVKTELRVVTPPENLYNCPKAAIPRVKTEADVAHLMVDLKKESSVCRNSINAVKAYMDGARAATRQ